MRAQEKSNVFVVDIPNIKPTIVDVQREGNSAGSVMDQDILRLCKTKEKQTSGRGTGGPRKPDVGKKGSATHHVRQVETEGTQGDDCEYAFSILDDSNVSSDGEIPVKIGGLPVTMIIDSGASCNVIGRNVREYLKANKVACVSTKASKKLYAYGSNQPLKVVGVFNAEVSVGGSVLSGVEFVFVKNGGHVLVGRETAISLGVLKLGGSREFTRGFYG